MWERFLSSARTLAVTVTATICQAVCQALDQALQALVPAFPTEACSAVPSGSPGEAGANPAPQGRNWEAKCRPEASQPPASAARSYLRGLT